jgi:hypothetical protein
MGAKIACADTLASNRRAVDNASYELEPTLPFLGQSCALDVSIGGLDVADTLTHTVFLPLLARPAQWHRLENGLPDDWIRDIAICPTSPHEILVAFRDMGVYKSADDGLSPHRCPSGSSEGFIVKGINPRLTLHKVTPSRTEPGFGGGLRISVLF